MRILQINAVSGIRSTGRIVNEVAKFLEHNGHAALVAYSAGIPFKNGFKIGNKLDTKIHALLSRLTGKQAYFSYLSTQKLIHYLKRIKPDVVHLHNLHGNFIHLSSLLGYLAKKDIPTVITLHDCWFYTGKCTHYTVDQCYKWQTGCGKCPRLKKDNPSWFFDRTREMHRDKKDWFSAIPRLAVVGVSDWVTHEAHKSFLSKARILTRVYNWIDTDIFKPVDTVQLRKKLNLQNKFVVLGVASGWSAAKGLDYFNRLAAKLSTDMAIMLVGGKSDSALLAPSIIHVGETHNANELAGFYSMADVYLHLSREETFGKTIAEALSCGTPAVVFNLTACPEVVGENCGYVVPPGDLEAVHQAILRIREEGKTKYTQNCMEFAQRNFNPETNIRQMLDVYQQISKV